MTQNKRRIDRILEGEYLVDLGGRSIEDIRIMKSDISEEEALVSYERRMLHGRLAILRAELTRRAGGGEGASIVEMLPQILADENHQNRGSFPMGDPSLPDNPTRRVSKLVSDDTLANLAQLTDAQVQHHIDELEAAERETSSVRASVLHVLDELNREIARRYASGEVDPGDALATN